MPFFSQTARRSVRPSGRNARSGPTGQNRLNAGIRSTRAICTCMKLVQIRTRRAQRATHVGGIAEVMPVVKWSTSSWPVFGDITNDHCGRLSYATLKANCAFGSRRHLLRPRFSNRRCGRHDRCRRSTHRVLQDPEGRARIRAPIRRTRRLPHRGENRLN
jgi:hypothetical protein